MFSPGAKTLRRLRKLSFGADDVRLRAAVVGQAQQPRDGIERHLIAEMKREHGALGLIQRRQEEFAQPASTVPAFGELFRSRLESRNVGEHLLILHQWSGPVDSIQRFVANDCVEPGGEARPSLERGEMAVRLQEDILSEVGRCIAIAGEPQTPTRNALVMSAKELVDRGIAFAP